ncbi:hypothetical protein GCM10027597_18620 [Saccharopolyspora tripterygii]
MVLAYLCKGETYADLAGGFGIGLATVFRYIREALDVLATMTSPLAEAVETARRKAFVILLDGTLLRIDRVGMSGGRDRPFYSGKQKRHGLNVQVLADPAGRLIWTSPALPGARHDMGAAREHGLLAALAHAGVRVIADSAYRGAEANVEVPYRRPPRDPETGDRRRRLSANEKAVNTAHARLRGPGERANAQLKSWKILRKVRSSPRLATRLVNAVRSDTHTALTQVENVHCCNLDPGHPSEHVSFVQSQDYGDNETLISWWVWWSEAGHSLSARKECEVERLSQNLDADLCLLPTGHWGRHAYVSSGPGGGGSGSPNPLPCCYDSARSTIEEPLSGATSGRQNGEALTFLHAVDQVWSVEDGRTAWPLALRVDGQSGRTAGVR